MNASPWDTNRRLGDSARLLPGVIPGLVCCQPEQNELRSGARALSGLTVSPSPCPHVRGVPAFHCNFTGTPEAKEETNSILQFECWTVFWCEVDLSIPSHDRAIGDGFLLGDITALVFRAVCFWHEDTPCLAFLGGYANLFLFTTLSILGKAKVMSTLKTEASQGQDSSQNSHPCDFQKEYLWVQWSDCTQMTLIC